VHLLGYRRKYDASIVTVTLTREQVVYQAGINEKLLGDFIRKHNVREKIFSMCYLFEAQKDS
jgi:hypothetical protein